MNLNELTIVKSIVGLKESKFSSEELVKSCFKRIKIIDPKINAFVTVNEEGGLKAAGEVDVKLAKSKSSSEKEELFKEFPLLGIPLAVKDNFCTKGIKTTASAKVLEEFVPEYESTVVKKLKSAGAIIIGKTNMDAWAHGSSTESSDFFPTKNPWNTKRLPGGSSGGSTAAIAADLSIAAIGSETAGSIRQPAAWCGVTGLKPTYGRVSRFGVIAMASSTDSPGPITKTVEDSALMLKVMAGKDELDATSSDKEIPDYFEKLNEKMELSGIKIGVPKEYFINGIDPDVEKNSREAIAVLEKAGAEIIEVSLLDPRYSVAVYTILQRSEVSSNLARFDGIRYGKERSYFGDEAKRRIMLGTYTLSSGYYDQYYRKAQKARTLILRDFDKTFKKVDLVIGPTSPCPALPLGATKNEAMFGELQDILVEASSIAGLPGINIPSGFSKDDLPTGIQLIGPNFSEELLLRIGHLFQKLTEWHLKKPKL